MIGAAIAKTGLMAPYDATFAAVEQLIEETNASGGIDGHKVRVVQADTRSDPQQAVLAVQQVIEEGADVLVFSGEALNAAAGAPVAEEHDQLNFSNAPTSPASGRRPPAASPSAPIPASSARRAPGPHS